MSFHLLLPKPLPFGLPRILLLAFVATNRWNLIKYFGIRSQFFFYGVNINQIEIYYSKEAILDFKVVKSIPISL